jgi:hypothetical protein
MAYEYLAVGTQKITDQAFIGTTNPNYTIRLFHVMAVGSTSNAQITIGNVSSLRTATDASDLFLTLPLTQSGPSMMGYWDNHYGFLLDHSAVLFMTSTGFSYALIGYQVVKK